MNDCENLPDNFIEQKHITIGKNVKRLRQEKSISQLKLSHAMGYKSVTTVSCAEIYHNKIHFNIEHLLKIAFVLDVDIDEFFK
ncbi:MAG: XRE family transcriptional regulator [Epsilonproteobacteria bacterium]|nr:MAG: XRE family transcriptional regulator [Campylobacterota bacterium]